MFMSVETDITNIHEKIEVAQLVDVAYWPLRPIVK